MIPVKIGPDDAERERDPTISFDLYTSKGRNQYKSLNLHRMLLIQQILQVMTLEISHFGRTQFLLLIIA
jgi:hypothetical protein